METESPASPPADPAEIISPASPVEIASPPQSPMSASDTQSPTRLFIFEEPTVIPTSPDKAGVVYDNKLPRNIPTTPPRIPTIRRIELDCDNSASDDSQLHSVGMKSSADDAVYRLKKDDLSKETDIEVVDKPDIEKTQVEIAVDQTEEMAFESKGSNALKSASFGTTDTETDEETPLCKLVPAYKGNAYRYAVMKLYMNYG